MHFVADENVPRPVLDRLRMSGYDVMSIQETVPGISDPEVLKVARSQSRILITADQDFGELTVRHRLGASGIVIIQLGRLSNAARADRVAGGDRRTYRPACRPSDGHRAGAGSYPAAATGELIGWREQNRPSR